MDPQIKSPSPQQKESPLKRHSEEDQGELSPKISKADVEDVEEPGLRRSGRPRAPRSVPNDVPASKPSRKRKSIAKPPSASTPSIDDEDILKIIYDPERAKNEYVVTAGTALETIFEQSDSDSTPKPLGNKKTARLTVYPTDPGDGVVSKRKKRKEMVKKKGLKMVKGCGAILDKKGKVDAKKVKVVVEAMQKVL